MSTMTIIEAEQILNIACTALQEKSQHSLHPISSLKGYDAFQIAIALKLRIANEFLVLAGRPDCEKKISESINVYSGILYSIFILFVPDVELEELSKLPRGSHEYWKQRMNIAPSPFDDSKGFKDNRLAELETGSSFGDYCKLVGSEDQLYWQKIYTRIGLEYTSTSPRGNDPVPLKDY
jgi:hypothetical protein